VVNNPEVPENVTEIKTTCPTVPSISMASGAKMVEV
jgi:hypothetical protein